MKKCKSCGTMCEDDAKFCDVCGNKFEEIKVEEVKVEEAEVVETEGPKIVECPICGAKVDVKESINCPVCGASLANERPITKKEVQKTSENKKNKLATLAFIFSIITNVESFTFAMLGLEFIGYGLAIAAIVLGIVALCNKVTGKSKVFAIIAIALAAESMVMIFSYQFIEPLIEEFKRQLEETINGAY